MLDSQKEPINPSQKNQVNNQQSITKRRKPLTPEQKARRAIYYKEWFNKDRERNLKKNLENSRKYRALRKKPRLAHNLRRTKYNLLALEPRSIYYEDTKNGVHALILAFHRIGVYGKSFKMKSGKFKVLKLMLWRVEK